MKMKMRKYFMILSALMVVFVSVTRPISVKADFWSDEMERWEKFKQNWNQMVSDNQAMLFGALATDNNDDGWFKGAMLGSILQQQPEYYNQPTKIYDYINGMYKDYPSTVGTNNPYYYTYEGFADNSLNASNNNFIDNNTNDYSTTNRYQVFNDNSDYSTNQYDYTWYNPITNNYNNCDSFYYDNSTNSYYYETNIGSINYENYVIDNSTHVTYYIVQTDTSSGVEYEFIYDIYYRLPDGRSSYDLRKEDVWGEYFVYNIVNYDSVAEDDGKTLGLWHLDGNGNDSSYWNNSVASFNDLSYGDGIFSKGKYSSNDESALYTLNLDKCDFDSSSPFTLEWFEFIPFRETVVEDLSNQYASFYGYYATLYGYIFPSRQYVLGATSNAFNACALVYDGSNYSLFINGILRSVSAGSSASEYYNSSLYCGFNISNSKITWSPVKGKIKGSDVTNGWQYDYIYQHYETIIDEIRLSKGVLYTSNYIPTSEPYTTNTVLVIPEDAEKGDIVIHSNYDVSNFRIGGAKPTFPTNNYVYVALDDDDVVTSVQQYQVNKWVEVAGRVYLGNDTTEDLVGYDMATFKVVEPEEDSGSSGGSNGGDDDSQSGSDGFDISSLIQGIKDIFEAISSAVGTAFSSIADLLSSAIDSLSLFTNFSSDFSNFLGQAFSFIPQEIWGVVGAGITLLVLVGIIKILRG